MDFTEQGRVNQARDALEPPTADERRAPPSVVAALAEMARAVQQQQRAVTESQP